MKIISKILLFLLMFERVFFFSNTSFADSGSGTISDIDSSYAEEIIPDLVITYPDLNITIQSGIKLRDDTTYYCKKEDCKLNLTVEDYFNDEIIMGDYYCIWNFGGGVWKTKDTDKKCNPGYVDYSLGDHRVSIEIFKKSDDSIVTSDTLKFRNDFGGEEDTENEETNNSPTSSETESTSSGSVEVGTGGTTELTQTGAIENTQTGSSSFPEESHNGSETNSGEISDDGGSLDKVDFKKEILIPEIIFEIQSGLEETGTGGELYACKKEDCKVNLSVEDIFTGSFVKNDYQCDWNFGSGSFKTDGTDRKCNPGYVEYGSGSHEIQLKISYKDNLEQFSTGSLHFINPFGVEAGDSTEELSGTGTVSNKNASGSGSVTELSTIGILSSDEDSQNGTLAIIPEPTESVSYINSNISVFTQLQQPSYVNESAGNYHCDTSKKECKVNFLFEPRLSGEKVKKIKCRISTNLKDKEIESCNPGTLIVPEGRSEFSIDVLDYETLNIIQTKKFSVENSGYIAPVRKSSGSSGSKKKREKLKLTSPNIEIQSGLDSDRNCKKKECNINLIYQEKKGEKCLWEFPEGKYTKNTISKCNPGYIKYFNYGEYKIKLKVYDSEYPSHSISKTFSFNNKNKKEEEIKQSESKKSDIRSEEDFETKFQIDLQGRKTDKKQYSGDMILCYMNPCNINLDGSESQRSDTSKINLNWKIGDHTFVGNNPKALWFDAGTYNVKAYDENNVHQLQLIVLEDEQRSEDKQDVSGSGEINNEEIYDEYLTHALEISAIVANPRGVDSNEYIELHNTGTKDISLRGLIIDDILDAGSKAYVIENDIVLKAGSKKKFYKSLTKLNLNNDGDSVYLHYFGEQIDTLSWDFSPGDNFVITPFNSKIIPQKVLVSRIIDGDTIEIIFENGTKEKLRLVGIDTPEIYNTTDQNEIKHGKRAKSFASEQLYQKSVFFIPEESGQRDTYGRLLGYIQMSDQRIFNQLVIEKGYSRAYLRYPFKYQVAFKKAQTKAKKDKIGIWSDSQFKKIVSKELKLDNEILENSEKTVQYEESLVFYKDQNNDKIPDQFQNSLLNSPDTSTVQEKSSTLNISNTGTTQLEEYQNFVQKGYYIKVSKLLSGIKFSGKTIPNAKIHLELQDKEILIQSSPSGDFEYLLEESFLLGEYTVHSQLTDIFGNKFDIEKEKVFQIDEKYLEKLRISQEKKAIALAKKLEKERLRRLKKLQKSKRATTKKGPKIYSNILISQVQAQSTFNASSKQKDLDILTFIIFILSLFILFHIFRHKKLV